jgi:hypothetical protein
MGLWSNLLGKTGRWNGNLYGSTRRDAKTGRRKGLRTLPARGALVKHGAMDKKLAEVYVQIARDAPSSASDAWATEAANARAEMSSLVIVCGSWLAILLFFLRCWLRWDGNLGHREMCLTWLGSAWTIFVGTFEETLVPCIVSTCTCSSSPLTKGPECIALFKDRVNRMLRLVAALLKEERKKEQSASTCDTETNCNLLSGMEPY